MEVPLIMSSDLKNKKITDYTKVIRKESNSSITRKRSISNLSPPTSSPSVKWYNMDNQKEKPLLTASECNDTAELDPIASAAENASLQKALSPLITEFHHLRESIDTVHADYADLKQTIAKQTSTTTQDLSRKIESNAKQLTSIAVENKSLSKENKELWDRLTKLESVQLSNNIIITSIQEGPFEPYHTTKLRVQEMIATTFDSGDITADLETAKKVEITGCSCIRKYRHNRARPVSVTFKLHDDKELFLSCKRKLPAGIYANEEYPIHVKRTWDQLLPILKLAKSFPAYCEKSRLDGDKLLINVTRYGVDELDRLPAKIAAYKATEKSNDSHIVFAGELSPYSNFHPSSFTIDGQTYHSSEQYIQYQKALTFGDSYVANKILNAQTAIECKRLSYQINGVDANRWHNDGYDICYEGVQQKFLQNDNLLSMLKTTAPKILVEATPDRLWGTGISLHDNSALDTCKSMTQGWLSRMLINIRSDY